MTDRHRRQGAGDVTIDQVRTTPCPGEHVLHEVIQFLQTDDLHRTGLTTHGKFELAEVGVDLRQLFGLALVLVSRADRIKRV